MSETCLATLSLFALDRLGFYNPFLFCLFSLVCCTSMHVSVVAHHPFLPRFHCFNSLVPSFSLWEPCASYSLPSLVPFCLLYLKEGQLPFIVFFRIFSTFHFPLSTIVFGSRAYYLQPPTLTTNVSFFFLFCNSSLSCAITLFLFIYFALIFSSFSVLYTTRTTSRLPSSL